jgi:hypothetical protein
MTAPEDDYLCVGICMLDPDSGYCLGCGRPPLPVSSADHGIVTEVQPSHSARFSSPDPDTP